MSIKRLTYVRITCDDCGEHLDEEGEDGFSLYLSGSEAVDRARDYGWDCTDGKHLCEDCLPEDDEASLEGPVGLTP